MIRKVTGCILIFFSFLYLVCGQNNGKNRWEVKGEEGVILRLNSNTDLPYKDNIEMSGKKVSSIIYYEIDSDKHLTLKKDIIFPQLRTFNKSNEPDWKKYRAYFRRECDQKFSPKISFDQETIVHSKIDSIEINGTLSFHYAPERGLKLTKHIYPSMDDRVLVEEWELTNQNADSMDLSITNFEHVESEMGYKGVYSFVGFSQSPTEIMLLKDESHSFPIINGALLNEESRTDMNYLPAKSSRKQFLEICKDNLVLKSPDPVINMLFFFAKIRAAESIFNSSMGLVHSPGGGNYYVGIWANDQVEYSGPFFPYLGYGIGNIAAYNTYLKFLDNIPQDDRHIAYAFEVDGNFAMTHLDRGDAAMIAYGTSLYLLNSGNIDQAEKLWPLIKWALDYCENQKNEQGAVQSASDEMEGRIETGSANLSTSCLYYGGLKYASAVARKLNMEEYSKELTLRQTDMEQVIENYFGANIQGHETYRYFEENVSLRHWICLPLTMGLTKRKKGTLDALFDKLWTENGILVEYKDQSISEDHVFWDRATLYALRGAMKVGALDLALSKLKQYSSERLLGDHVPYPVEAFPENNMKHLSAESALYCRIFIEGLLGIEPVSFSEFRITPSLPEEWDTLELNNFYLFGNPYDLSINRDSKSYKVILKDKRRTICDKSVGLTESITIRLKDG